MLAPARSPGGRRTEESVLSDACQGGCGEAPCPARRRLFKAMSGWLMALPFAHAVRAQEDGGAKARPRAGDQFVFAASERQDQVIAPADLAPDAAPLLAYPIDPQTQVIRKGSRLNQIVLVRLTPEHLTDSTRRFAAEGIVAYSAFCTHRGCPVIGWEAETRMLKCPCHDSRFDPKDGARVSGGPAKRRLAALPLRLAAGALMAADGFSRTSGRQAWVLRPA